MAPVNQLGVLAFASAVLAVPHAQWQPFKRHAHPGAPPAYGSSADPTWSSSEAPVSSAPPSYPSGSSVDPVSGSSWSAPAYPSGSSVAPVSGSSSVSAPPYPSASGSKSGWGYSTGGYGYGSSAWGTGYSSYASSGPTEYSTCVETSTLIYRSTTLYSTYTITHTDYESAPASSVAPASDGGYSAPAYSAPAGSDPGWGSAPASSPASPTGASCVPDVTVTETVQTTVYVTPGAPSGAAPSYGGGSWGAPEPSSAAAAPSSAAAPSYPAGTSSAPAAPSYSAPASGAPGGGAAGTLGKRGLAYNDANLANALAGSNAGGWAYNWLSDSSGLDSSIPYIPMLWGPSSDFTGTWEANAQKGIANGAQYLFSFNEADMSTQANLSPEAAAAAWKQYMEPFAGQAKLVAPSVTNSQDASGGLNWLQQFFDACSDCTIDAVAQHWYFPTNDVQNFKDQITNAAKIGGGKGVWVNEFGATGSDQDKSDFLSEVLPWLDSNPDVLGYSYFMVSDGLLMTGDSPSSYGQTYVS